MKLQRIFTCIAGVFIAVGLVAFQASAGSDPSGDCSVGPAKMQLEINALRAGGKTIVTSPNDTTKVSVKARILKGTAPTGTTIVTNFNVEASTGGTVIGSASSGGITLGVGKGGKGTSLTVLTESCTDDFITFTATVTGLDEDNDLCEATRLLRKACR